jgi:hypothetical protein
VKNPFKVGDKIITKVRGAEVEGVVTKLWQNEVQVRTAGNELLWRTVYTVWYPGGSPMARPGKAGAKTSPTKVPAKIAPISSKKGPHGKNQSVSRKPSRKRH